MNKTTPTEEVVRDYILNEYVNTGKHLFVSDVAKALQTSAALIRRHISDVRLFDVFDADRQRKPWENAVQSPAVEPTKHLLRVALIKRLRAEESQ